jgi:hypothetical protein
VLFELRKYDYFRLATPGRKIEAADKPDSGHRETKAWGVLKDVRCKASVRHVGT